MKLRLFPILGLSVALSGNAQENADTTNAQIESILSTYSQEVQNVIRKSYCYENRENAWIREKSVCVYDVTGKAGILRNAQLREEIRAEFNGFPKELQIEELLIYKYFVYYGENLGTRVLEKQLQNIKDMKGVIEKIGVQAFKNLRGWDYYMNGKYRGTIAQYEKLGDIRGGEVKKSYITFKN